MLIFHSSATVYQRVIGSELLGGWYKFLKNSTELGSRELSETSQVRPLGLLEGVVPGVLLYPVHLRQLGNRTGTSQKTQRLDLCPAGSHVALQSSKIHGPKNKLYSNGRVTTMARDSTGPEPEVCIFHQVV